MDRKLRKSNESVSFVVYTSKLKVRNLILTLYNLLTRIARLDFVSHFNCLGLNIFIFFGLLLLIMFEKPECILEVADYH